MKKSENSPRTLNKGRGRVIVISGPSGVGKSTICNILLKKRSDLWFSVSTTSRIPRKGEKPGQEYHFISRLSFQKQIELGKFIEYAEVHGNLYGTPLEPMENALVQGKNALLDIDVQGAKKIMGKFPDGIFIFLIPPDFKDLLKRLEKRNTDDTGEIKKRLIHAQKEMEYRKDYEYVIENLHIDDTIVSIISILKKELDQKSS